MKYTEQELAEKMKKRLASERDRQHRWRLRQKEKGLQPIAGMVSKEAVRILNAEKEITGETTSTILEKAILNLPSTITSTSEDIFCPAPDLLSDIPSPKENSMEYKESIFNRIKKMRREDNLPFNEIAKIFNEEGLKTLSGDAVWDGKNIYSIYKKI
ncbi:MAG: hypothetical protein C0403_01615 [Desulfobacterium sp.]|nr:hypothetical protein [Desulfobacterium sp.]